MTRIRIRYHNNGPALPCSRLEEIYGQSTVIVYDRVIKLYFPNLLYSRVVRVVPVMTSLIWQTLIQKTFTSRLVKSGWKHFSTKWWPMFFVFLESFEMLCWRRLNGQRGSWMKTFYEKRRDENVLVAEMTRKTNWLVHITRGNELLLDAIEGEIEGTRQEVTGI